MSTTIQPKIAALVRRGDTEQARLVYRTATVWLVLVAWPVYLTFAVFAPHLLRVFGDGYDAGWQVIVLLSLTMLVATSCGAVDTVLVMAGKSSWTMINALVALAVNIGLNLLLIPDYGILGAAVAWSAAILLNNIVPLTQLHLSMALHPFGRTIAGAGFLAVSCFAVVPGTLVLAGAPVAAAAAAVVVGGTVYATLLWRFREAFELTALTAVRRSPAKKSGRAEGRA